MQLRPRVGRARMPCWDPKLVKLGADLALSAEVPTGPGASFGLPISSARGWPKASTTSKRKRCRRGRDGSAGPRATRGGPAAPPQRVRASRGLEDAEKREAQPYSTGREHSTPSSKVAGQFAASPVESARTVLQPRDDEASRWQLDVCSIARRGETREA